MLRMRKQFVSCLVCAVLTSIPWERGFLAYRCLWPRPTAKRRTAQRSDPIAAEERTLVKEREPSSEVELATKRKLPLVLQAEHIWTITNPKARRELTPADPDALLPAKPEEDDREVLAVRSMVQSYLRMQDVGRLVLFGLEDHPGDGRGFAAVALCRLRRFKDAATLAMGENGETPCGPGTLRYVANQMATIGAFDYAVHLAKLQRRIRAPEGDKEWSTPGLRMVHSMLEIGVCYLKSTAEQMPRHLSGNGHEVALRIEEMLKEKSIDDLLAATPNRRYKTLTKVFNQLIKWFSKARLVPQALRLCEIMSMMGVPRDEMTVHFLSQGAAAQFGLLKTYTRKTQEPPDLGGQRPEVVFVGRVNSGKSSLINALLSSTVPYARASRKMALTESIGFYEINRERTGLPHFAFVDTPGMGYAGVKASRAKNWPQMVKDYFTRQSLRHVFHCIDARSQKLRPGDKQIINMLSQVQRPHVKYTIVITKIDIVTRRTVERTAASIKKELEPYFDVDIMYASGQTYRGIEHVWSKVWESVCETPRGQRHIMIGPTEYALVQQRGGRPPPPKNVAEMLGLKGGVREEERPMDFDQGDWVEVASEDVGPEQEPDTALDSRWENYFDDEEGEDGDGFDDYAQDGFEKELERRWQESERKR